MYIHQSIQTLNGTEFGSLFHHKTIHRVNFIDYCILIVEQWYKQTTQWTNGTCIVGGKFGRGTTQKIQLTQFVSLQGQLMLNFLSNDKIHVT